jgi:hypothetical protein
MYVQRDGFARTSLRREPDGRDCDWCGQGVSEHRRTYTYTPVGDDELRPRSRAGRNRFCGLSCYRSFYGI